MVKTLSNKEVVVNLKIPKDLIKGDQPACQINALKILFHNLGHDLDNTMLKTIFQYDQDGALNERYHFQNFTTHLRNKDIPYTTNRVSYNDIRDTFIQLDNSINLCVPIFFEMSILKVVIPQLKNFKVDVGSDIYDTNTKHILLLVGYKKGGEILLFLDPLYQLPNEDLTPIEVSYRDVSQHSKHIKKYIKVAQDAHQMKRVSKKEHQKRIGEVS